MKEEHAVGRPEIGTPVMTVHQNGGEKQPEPAPADAPQPAEQPAPQPTETPAPVGEPEKPAEEQKT